MHSYRERFRIYRRRHDRWIFGVCGGLADHFDLPALPIRLGFVLLACINASFIALYILLALLMKQRPHEPYQSFEEEEFFNSFEASKEDVLKKAERSFSSLEKRMQNLESIVTRPGFEHEEEFRKL